MTGKDWAEFGGVCVYLAVLFLANRRPRGLRLSIGAVVGDAAYGVAGLTLFALFWLAVARVALGL